jgi:hypothetical protein
LSVPRPKAVSFSSKNLWLKSKIRSNKVAWLTFEKEGNLVDMVFDFVAHVNVAILGRDFQSGHVILIDLIDIELVRQKDPRTLWDEN